MPVIHPLWTPKGEPVASITDVASSGASAGSPRLRDETPTVAWLNTRAVMSFTDPSPVLGALRTRAEGSLRKQLFFGDLAAAFLARGFPTLFQSRLRPDQLVAVRLAAAVSTLAVLLPRGGHRRGGLASGAAKSSVADTLGADPC